MATVIARDLIKAVTEQRPFGNGAPYTRETQSAIDDHFESVASAIEAVAEGEVIRQFRFPTVKAASFGKIFFPKPDGSSRHVVATGEVTAGIVVYLCRFAPLAVWGCGARTTTASSTFYAECSSSLVYQTPKLGNWRGEAALVDRAVRDKGFSLPSRDELQAPMPFSLPFESALMVGKPCVFDGLFYIY